uniref:Uncharacterized protein n=1 Tax=Aplanochytrium stocchinoi TaxID=215587 RepID=A0A7S3PIL9_9STRA
MYGKNMKNPDVCCISLHKKDIIKFNDFLLEDCPYGLKKMDVKTWCLAAYSVKIGENRFNKKCKKLPKYCKIIRGPNVKTQYIKAKPFQVEMEDCPVCKDKTLMSRIIRPL